MDVSKIRHLFLGLSFLCSKQQVKKRAVYGDLSKQGVNYVGQPSKFDYLTNSSTLNDFRNNLLTLSQGKSPEKTLEKILGNDLLLKFEGWENGCQLLVLDRQQSISVDSLYH